MQQPNPSFPFQYDDEIADAMARCLCDTVACFGGCTVGGRYNPETDYDRKPNCIGCIAA